MRTVLFKTLGATTLGRSQKLGRCAAVLILAGLTTLTSCNTQPGPRAVTVQSLEIAPVEPPARIRRAVLSDWTELKPLYFPLGRRLGMFQIRNSRDWERLRAAAPVLGPPPDFNSGIVVALASHAGMPVDGAWPIHLDSIRIHNGAGFACGSFSGGSYLPNGVTYVETAQYDGLACVVMVEIDGTRFYPE